MSPHRTLALIAVSAAACTVAVPTAGLVSTGPSGSPGAGDAAPSSSLDAAVIADPDLLASWSFEESSPSVAVDHSGHGHELRLTGAKLASGGPHGLALDLDGSGYAEAPTLDGAAFPTSGTLSLWFKWDHPATETTPERDVFDAYASDRSHLFLRHPTGATGDAFQIAGQIPNTADYAFAHDFTLSRDRWHRITFTWDEHEQHSHLYVDGALTRDEIYRVAAFVPSGQRCRLGDGFIGSIDEIRLYSACSGPPRLRLYREPVALVWAATERGGRGVG